MPQGATRTPTGSFGPKQRSSFKIRAAKPRVELPKVETKEDWVSEYNLTIEKLRSWLENRFKDHTFDDGVSSQWVIPIIVGVGLGLMPRVEQSIYLMGDKWKIQLPEMLTEVCAPKKSRGSIATASSLHYLRSWVTG